MGKTIRVIIALVVILGTAYWAVNRVRERTYSGSKLDFRVGKGSVVVTNRGQELIPVEMRSAGRTSTFRVESAELDLKQTSKRQSVKGNVYHVVSIELPPGQARIDVTRGSNVRFVSESNQRIDAVVTPGTSSDTRTTLILAGVVILAALYYISRLFDHQWVGVVRSKLPLGKVSFRRTT